MGVSALCLDENSIQCFCQEAALSKSSKMSCILCINKHIHAKIIQLLYSTFSREGPVKCFAIFLGYARISNVEFVRSGQEGFIDPWDSRSAVAFIDAGTVSAIKPSYVRHCAFHHSYAPSVTAYGTNNLPIEWNVMADNVWFGKSAKNYIALNYSRTHIFFFG